MKMQVYAGVSTLKHEYVSHRDTITIHRRKNARRRQKRIQQQQRHRISRIRTRTQTCITLQRRRRAWQVRATWRARRLCTLRGPTRRHTDEIGTGLDRAYIGMGLDRRWCTLALRCMISVSRLFSTPCIFAVTCDACCAIMPCKAIHRQDAQRVDVRYVGFRDPEPLRAIGTVGLGSGIDVAPTCSSRTSRSKGARAVLLYSMRRRRAASECALPHLVSHSIVRRLCISVCCGKYLVPMRERYTTADVREHFHE